MERANESRGWAVPYPVFSWGFWPRYLVHMRPYLLFVSGIAAFTGMALSPRPDWSKVLLAGIPFFLSYGFGQALTDVFQTDTDSISSGYRPLVRGEISKVGVFGVSLAGFALGVSIIITLSPLVAVLGAITVLGLLLYTPLKRTWWGGPPWNSWIVALLVTMGFLSVGGTWSELRSLPRHVLLATLSVFFAYANFVVGGYFKDISADRVTGYHTFPVRFGWFAGAVYSDVVSLLAALFSALCIAPQAAHATGPAALVGWGIWALAVLVNLRAQVGLHGTRDEQAVGAPIAAIVRSMLLYCMAMIVTFQPGWLIPVAIFQMLFELTLRVRPQHSQV